MIAPGYDGSIKKQIINTGISEKNSIFSLPRAINNPAVEKYWIRHYPSSLCSESESTQSKLYLAPFDCRAREFLEKVVKAAEQFAFFSTESFTDREFTKFLQKMALDSIELRVITGMQSRDFNDRIQMAFRELLAHGILLKTTEQRLHAKLLLTDKHLVVSSVNLNMMNLGFAKTKEYWRANTESIAVCSDPPMLAKAKEDYIRVFDSAVDVESKLAEKVEEIIKDMFTMFGLRSTKEVKRLFSRFVVKKEIEFKKSVFELGSITAKLVQHFGKNIVTKDAFLMSLILYELSERKQDFDQLQESISILDCRAESTKALLFQLHTDQFIDVVDGYYKIRLDALNP